MSVDEEINNELREMYEAMHDPDRQDERAAKQRVEKHVDFKRQRAGL